MEIGCKSMHWIKAWKSHHLIRVHNFSKLHLNILVCHQIFQWIKKGFFNLQFIISLFGMIRNEYNRLIPKMISELENILVLVFCLIKLIFLSLTFVNNLSQIKQLSKIIYQTANQTQELTKARGKNQAKNLCRQMWKPQGQQLTWHLFFQHQLAPVQLFLKNIYFK